MWNPELVYKYSTTYRDGTEKNGTVVADDIIGAIEKVQFNNIGKRGITCVYAPNGTVANVEHDWEIK